MPKVSVVIAAYNSSRRLKCAVTSVLQQSYTDLEVIVVGDCWTDDSGDVLQSMDNPRIRWENLDLNWGEQSVASNRGIDLARGEYIFFLNQDDLWIVDHVSETLLMLEGQQLDLVWSPFLVIPAGVQPGRQQSALPRIRGTSPSHPSFDSRTFIPASCIAWRSSSLRQINGWRTAAEVSVSPSQDLLWRAKRAGLRILGKKSPSVVVLWSGARPGSYLSTFQAEENEFWLNAITFTPELLNKEFAEAVLRSDLEAKRGKKFSARRTSIQMRRKNYWLQFLASRMLGPLVEATGRHPESFFTWLKHRKVGGYINHVRAMNDLDRLGFRRASRGSDTP